MTDLKKNLEGLKGKLENLEENLDGQIKDLNNREEKWKKLDEEVEIIKKNANSIVKFNVSGELFATRKETLVKVKDTLFYKIVLSGKFDLTKEIFIDRDNKYFSVILNYLRKNKINYSQFSQEELQEFKNEADYYELVDIVAYIDDKLKEPQVVNFTFSGSYTAGGSVIGTNKLEDVSDKNMSTGICAMTPGWIIFELDTEYEICGVEVAGFTGNTTYWGASNGSNASILLSTDGVSFGTSVGNIPSGFSTSIQKVHFSRQNAKFVKFNHNSYLGLSHFKVIKA